MKKSILLFLIAIISCISLTAGAKNEKNNQSLLWRISRKDMQKPSYLFGTIHAICPEDYIWNDAMKTSLSQTDMICMEMDMDDPSLMMQIAMGMVDTSGKKLSEYFTTEQYAKLQKLLADSFSTDISMFQQMKPVVLATILTSKILPCPEPIAYESQLMEEAQKTKKEIVGLETAQEQLDLFDNLPTDSVVKEILDTGKDLDTDKKEFDALIDAYKKQDLPGLYALIKKSGEYDIDLGGFLDTRNEKWVPRMVSYMDQKSVFFAVGAGHLWGDYGLITLLRKAGYIVEPVR